ncbi:MAG: LacI family DNA-binding transcriptional regulator [Candidatus Omnitrophica bacterium]|nr:LacI family DNA-binding transcriptional regulator [Candidatus Omnitrophota bacterium]
MYRRVTIIDIARIAGVSTTTVSRVINGDGAKRSTKDRVLKVIEKHDYRPDTYAQYLGRRNRERFIEKNRRRAR